MNLIIQKKKVGSILSKSGIPGADYCINAYTGCSHGCRYCYATFMKRFTGHTEPWGGFVDVKMNAPDVLRRQLERARKGTVMVSSVTDAYQQVEARFRLTRQCLEVLLERGFAVDILTKSPLVLRDMDLIRKFREIEVGITVTTDDEKIRKVFEPNAPPIRVRLNTLKTLHAAGIKTYAFIGPVLPMDPETVAGEIFPYVESVIIDRMNYTSKTRAIYERMKLARWLEKVFLDDVIAKLEKHFSGKNLSIC